MSTMAMLPAADVRGGGGEQPAGFEVGLRFRPTEVDFYLRRRAGGDSTVPMSFIRELDVYKYRPWHLPHHLFPYCNTEEREMYFFTRRRRATGNSSKRFSRTVDEGGLWDGHAAGKAIHKAGNDEEKIDKKRKKSTLWVLHEYRLVGDKPDDVVLCRIHKRKGEGEGEDEDEEEVVALPVFNAQQTVDGQASLPAVRPSVEVDAVAAADVDDDDLSFARLLEEELMEAEVEQRRVKRQRIVGGGGEAHQIIPSPTEKRSAKRQRTEQEEAHRASAVDTDDGLTMTLDEINTILGELPSNASQQRPVGSVDVEQLLKCLPLRSSDDLSSCLNPPLPAYAADEYWASVEDFVF